MQLENILHYETDDSCAICGGRGLNVLTIHHIDGDHNNNIYDNTILLCHNCHHKYHQNLGISLEDISKRKTNLMIKMLTQYGINAMKIADRNKFGVIALPFLLYHLLDFGYMSKEENQMGYGDQDDATARFSITENGKKLIEKWF